MDRKEPILDELGELIFDQIISPKGSSSFKVKKGQFLRITDIKGKQVGDLIVLNEHDLKEQFHPRNTRRGIVSANVFSPTPPRRCVGGVYFTNGVGSRLTTGHKLMSNINNPMMTITADTQVPGGTHDMFSDACASWIYETNGYPPRDGCKELFVKALKDYGFSRLVDIPTNINHFMNVPVDLETGMFCIEEPVTRPGDYIEFRAEMDCLCALTACPEDVLTKCNGQPPHPAKPLQVEIFNPK